MMSSPRLLSQYLSGESPGTSRSSVTEIWSRRKRFRALAGARPQARATTAANLMVEELVEMFVCWWLQNVVDCFVLEVYVVVVERSLSLIWALGRLDGPMRSEPREEH